MGSLAAALGPVAEGLTSAPRVYGDANLPAGLVRFMREQLGWDVLFVLEDSALRRAPDVQHYRLAAELRRTLVTLDRDYLDDRRFPPDEGAGVLVLTAPNEEQLERLLKDVDRMLFKTDDDFSGADRRLPLHKRKLHVHVDWDGAI